MQLLALYSALSVVALAAAQSNIIQVGAAASADGGMFQFIPPTLNATNGTTITFRFTGVPGNHSITQTSFANPCEPLAGGFDSGWVLIPQTPAEVPEWNLTITDASKPIWFYCKQLVPAPHCGAGMVGAINAPTTGNTFEAFRGNATAFKGPSGQDQGGLVGVGASASTLPGPIPSGVTLFVGPTSANGNTSATPTNTGSAGSSGTAAPNGASTSSFNSLMCLLAAVLALTLA